ncbi:acyl-CoA synthetase [Novosphingobium bradum]|uniref:Acyl-CoA synthetase n=1 Tax=Novosphingobium bradum TaxID=1737444 RepID=A0ABV7ILA1_9SPHN
MYPGNYARTQPDKPAAIRPSTGETLSYRALDERSNRLAQLLFAAGLRPGDHVALYSDNNLAFFDVTWACMRSGLYLTAVNRYLTAPEAHYIVDNCDAKALIVAGNLAATEELGRLATRCVVKLAVGQPVAGFDDYEAAIAAHPAEPLANERVGSFMLYSSGTTGKPKGIRRDLPDVSPVGGNPMLQNRVELAGFDTETIYLCPAPMYHGAPLGYTAAVIQAGGTVVLMDKFDAEKALEYIDRYQITHSQWVPTMFIRLLKLPDEVKARYDISSLRYALHAAAPCPIAVKRAMIDWWGPIIEEYYSSTESAGLAMISSAEWLAHPGSVGRAKGLPFHICDEEGNELPPGEPGLIYGEVTPGKKFAYYKDDEKTASVAHPSHADWIAVGDIGYLDEEGYLYLTDRKAFMIVSGGVNIYPQQIEDVLALHPKVSDVAVIGVPNPDLGEEVKAVVEAAAGVVPSAELAEEIKEFVRERLGRQLTPRTVDFVDELPRLPTGKLYKAALREKYWGSADTPKSLAERM